MYPNVSAYRLPTVRQSYLLSGKATYCQASYLLSGKLPTVRHAPKRSRRLCTQQPHTCTQQPHTCTQPIHRHAPKRHRHVAQVWGWPSSGLKSSSSGCQVNFGCCSRLWPCTSSLKFLGSSASGWTSSFLLPYFLVGSWANWAYTNQTNKAYNNQISDYNGG